MDRKRPASCRKKRKLWTRRYIRRWEENRPNVEIVEKEIRLALHALDKKLLTQTSIIHRTSETEIRLEAPGAISIAAKRIRVNRRCTSKQSSSCETLVWKKFRYLTTRR